MEDEFPFQEYARFIQRADLNKLLKIHCEEDPSYTTSDITNP